MTLTAMSDSPVLITEEVPAQCNPDNLRSLVAHHLEKLQLHPECTLSISFVDLDRMTDLHVQWMDEPGATDVLSFPMDELRVGDREPGILGDVVICPEFIEGQAREKGVPVSEEIEFLLTHGILHLIGYDHATEEDYAEMFALQDELLASWRGSAT